MEISIEVGGCEDGVRSGEYDTFEVASDYGKGRGTAAHLDKRKAAVTSRGQSMITWGRKRKPNKSKLAIDCSMNSA